MAEAANWGRLSQALSICSSFCDEFGCDRGREEFPLPALRTVHAVLPHTALQSVVSSSGLARLHTGFMKGEEPMHDVKNTYEEFLLLLLEELKYSPENVMPSSL